MTTEISSYISKCKNDYFIRLGKKLGDPSRSIKTYIGYTENFMEWEKGT